MNSHLNFFFQKKQTFVVLFLSLLGILSFVFLNNFDIVSKNSSIDDPYNFTENVFPENPTFELYDFNPNDLTEDQWKSLGFSDKQAETIMKYKNIVGGKFTSKGQFKKCYAISEVKYEQLAPYILLPEKKDDIYVYRNNRSNWTKRELNIPGKFNPDNYSADDWEKIGFSGRQASAIMKYKAFLGGSFISKEKFRECYIINSENYNKLQSYLLLPEKATEQARQGFSSKPAPLEKKINYSFFDPNDYDASDWMKIGFSEKQANVIMNYKNKILKGAFQSLDDVEKCFVISEDKFEEMKNFMTIKQDDVKEKVKPQPVEKEEINSDFSRTDLNEITFQQLKEFGFDDKAAGSFIGFRNKLGGFVTKNQIIETYTIDKEIADKLIRIAPLKTGNVKKYKLADAPESWLKEHPYFKYYADKILFYRISFSDDKTIFKKMNLKPEVEAKMKLYCNP